MPNFLNLRVADKSYNYPANFQNFANLFLLESTLKWLIFNPKYVAQAFVKLQLGVLIPRSVCLSVGLSSKNNKKQAGAELGQAQLKLELELCYTSFEILSYRLLQLEVASGLLVISYTPSLIVLAK